MTLVVVAIPDPLDQKPYAGLAAVVAFAAYELAIKDIFINFAEKKNKVFGAYVRSHFGRINGRINPEVLIDYVSRFGDKYKNRFAKRTLASQKSYMRLHKKSIHDCYCNLLAWRHAFVHQGEMPYTTTYLEVLDTYKTGKEMIHCLAGTMKL